MTPGDPTQNPAQPGAGFYDNFQRSPEWLQKYLTDRAGVGSGTLMDASDVYNQYAPEIAQMYGQVDGGGFQNPYFASGKMSGYNFDPFAYMRGGYSGIQQNAKGAATPWGPATNQWQMGVDPWTGKQIGQAWNTSKDWSHLTSPVNNLYIPSFGGSY